MLRKICVKRAISGCLPGTPSFFCDQKKEAKKSPAVADAVRGCARGATVERSETGERAMFAPVGQTTARAGLRSKLAALVVRRQAGPRLRGCTPPRPPKRKSEVSGAKRTQYYCPFLTPPNPRRGKWRPLCQRGLAALAAWGIPTGSAWPPVTPADGQESLRLACARHLPLTREAFLAGSARTKGSPLRGELAEPARPEGL